MPMKLIAVDVGSTYLKAAVLETADLTLLAQRAVAMPPKKIQEHTFEIDAACILQAVKGLIGELLQEHPDVGGIWMDTQMHGHILTAPDGSDPSPYISWQDALCTPLLEELREKLGPEALSHMGTRYKAGLAVCSFYARHKHAPLTQPTMLHTLGGWLLYELSGRDPAAHFCHESMAASLGLYDCARRQWNAHTLSVIGGQELLLPQVCDHTHQAGSYRGIPLYGDIGDHQASVCGLDGELNESIVLTLGTAGILCMPQDRFVVSDAEARPYFHGQYLLTRTRQPGGRTLDVLVNFMAACAGMIAPTTPGEIWQRLTEDGLSTDPKGLRVQPDYFLGYGEGVVQGIGSENLTPQSLFAAGLWGLADTLAETIGQMRKLRPQVKRLVLCGGRLVHLPELQQALAQATGLKVVCSEKQDEALYGLAKLAREVQG